MNLHFLVSGKMWRKHSYSVMSLEAWFLGAKKCQCRETRCLLSALLLQLLTWCLLLVQPQKRWNSACFVSFLHLGMIRAKKLQGIENVRDWEGCSCVAETSAVKHWWLLGFSPVKCFIGANLLKLAGSHGIQLEGMSLRDGSSLSPCTVLLGFCFSQGDESRYVHLLAPLRCWKRCSSTDLGDRPRHPTAFPCALRSCWYDSFPSPDGEKHGVQWRTKAALF